MTKPSRRSALQKRLSKIFLGFFVVLLAVVVALQTPWVQEKIQTAFFEKLEEETGLTFHASQSLGFFPFNPGFEDILVEENGQPLAHIEGFRLSWSPLSLLQDSLTIHSLQADRVSIFPSDKPFDPEDIPKEWPDLPINLRIQRLIIREFDLPDLENTFELQGRVQIDRLGGPFNLYADAVGLPGDPAHLSLFLGGQPKGQVITAKLTTFIPEASPLGQSLGLDSQGDLTLTLESKTELPKIRTSFFPEEGETPEDLDVHLKATLQVLQDSPLYNLTQDIQLEGDLKFLPPTQLSFSYNLLAGSLKGEGQGSVAGEQFQSFVGRLSLEDLSELNTLLDGELSGSAKALVQMEGSYDDPKVRLDLEGSDLQFDDLSAKSLQAASEIFLDKDGFFGDFLLALQSEGKAFSSAGHLAFSQEEEPLLSLSNLVLNTPWVDGEGHLKIFLESGLLEGTLISEAISLLELDQGQVSGSIDLSISETSEQNAKIAAVGKGLSIATVEIGEISLTGEVLDSFGEARGSGKLLAGDVIFPGVSLESMELDAEVSGDEIQWSGLLAGSFGKNSQIKNFNTSAKGKLRTDEEDLDLFLTEFSGDFSESPYEMLEPFDLHFGPSGFESSQLLVRFDEGVIKAKLSERDRQLEGMFLAESIPFSPFAIFISPSPMSGFLHIDFELGGSLTQPNSLFLLTLEDLRFLEDGFEQLPSMDVSVSGKVEEGRLGFGAFLDGLETQEFSSDISLPVEWSLFPFSIQLLPGEEVWGHLIVAGQLQDMLPILFSDLDLIRGDLDSRFLLEGVVGDSSITGNLALKNGIYENYYAGLRFEDIQASLVAEGSTLKLVELRGRNGGQGSITATGKLELDFENYLPYEVKTELKDIHLVNLAYANAYTNGTLDLKGNTQALAIAGDLQVSKGQVDLPQISDDRVPEIPVFFEGEQLPAAPADSFPISLALNVKADKSIEVFGRGLSSVWSGEVEVSGTDEHPQLVGRLNTVRGTFNLAGKIFQITSGTITFSGNPKDALISVSASLDLPDSTVTASIFGPLMRPTIKLNSSPPMPQDEILARVLFGSSKSKINVFQAAVLAQTALSLSGKGGPGLDAITGLQRQLQELFGLDCLEVSSLGEEDSVDDVNIRLSKQVIDGLYVTMDRAVGSEKTNWIVEANLTKELKIQVEMGLDSEGRIYLKWERDY